jgi:hypothetical protein
MTTAPTLVTSCRSLALPVGQREDRRSRPTLYASGTLLKSTQRAAAQSNWQRPRILPRSSLIRDRLFLLGLPVLLAGTWLGVKLYGHPDETSFRRVVLVLLLVSGAVLIF